MVCPYVSVVDGKEIGNGQHIDMKEIFKVIILFYGFPLPAPSAWMPGSVSGKAAWSWGSLS
ncbi:hypothetical protein OOT00_08545 [Desulfobotulus sp. H1]|uniref:Uncharacterized protein n=1 Tax=Desulfobotulus pelophilus TaxID=2823377 RepID=A0ABT3N990_9BACT|nr:hypothetical protein [Desulfobotulus pelophilus]MCW7754033.1 hypothetical protein [Desulfobotulus pelophilus]